MLDIINNFISNINYSEIITAVIVVALGLFISKIKPYVKELLNDSVQYLQLQIESSNYKNMISKAYDIWKLVDEDFRIGAAITVTFKSKADYFNSLLLEQFKSLTQSQIDYIRQIVAGNENSDKLTSDSEVIEEN